MQLPDRLVSMPGPARAGLLDRRAVLAALALLATGCAGRGDRQANLARGRVLVAGGSGRTGRYVMRELADGGIPFRATTRNVDEATGRLGAEATGVDWIAADLRDAEAARTAMRGIDHVICVIGSRELGGANSAEFVDYGAVRNLVDAARAEGVRHFVLLTAIGVTDPQSPANRIFKGALEWRFKGEEHLRASGLDYTVVRPGGLVDDPAGVKGVLLAQGDDWRRLRGSTITRGDLAAVLVECLRNPAADRLTFEIANDPALAPGAWRETLATLRPDLKQS
jgi:uncharacterized protein YbjT (DUF2867 family)